LIDFWSVGLRLELSDSIDYMKRASRRLLRRRHDEESDDAMGVCEKIGATSQPPTSASCFRSYGRTQRLFKTGVIGVTGRAAAKRLMLFFHQGAVHAHSSLADPAMTVCLTHWRQIVAAPLDV